MWRLSIYIWRAWEADQGDHRIPSGAHSCLFHLPHLPGLHPASGFRSSGLGFKVCGLGFRV